MRAPKIGLFGLFSASLLFISGCSADRFVDPGCVSDEECRLGRICSESVCVDPNGAEPSVEPDDSDAGPDADAEVDDPEPDVSSELNFVGQWSTRITGEVIQPNGRVEQIDEERVIVEVTEGNDADLTVEIREVEGFCPLDAMLIDENTFTLLDTECVIEQGEVQVIYQDVNGRGELNGEGVFNMTLQITAFGEAEGGQPFQAFLDLAFIEGMPVSQ